MFAGWPEARAAGASVAYAQIGSLKRRSAWLTIPPSSSVSMCTKIPSPQRGSAPIRRRFSDRSWHPRHSTVRDRSAHQEALRTRPIALRLRGWAPVGSGCSAICVRRQTGVPCCRPFLDPTPPRSCASRPIGSMHAISPSRCAPVHLTAVHVPTPEEEAFRDVVRAWQQSKRDVTAAKQRLKAFLLRNDIRYAGRASWSLAHRRWFARLVLPSPASRSSSKSSSIPCSSASAGANRLEHQLDALAPAWSGYRLALCAARVSRHPEDRRLYRRRRNAASFTRFSHPSRYMAWLGFVPSEHSPPAALAAPRARSRVAAIAGLARSSSKPRGRIAMRRRSAPSSSGALRTLIRRSGRSLGKRSCVSLINTADSSLAASTPTSLSPRWHASSQASSGMPLGSSSSPNVLSFEDVRRVADRCRG